MDTPEKRAGTGASCGRGLSTPTARDDAPCIKSAKNDAVTKRDDGIVIIDPEKSKGQRLLD